MGTKFSGSNAAPEIPLQKKALKKKALDFCLENWFCDRRETQVFECERFPEGKGFFFPVKMSFAPPFYANLEFYKKFSLS